jgi:tryptophanyl-tRNA synthetase
MGLDDPTAKMSKSNPNAGHAVSLVDSPDVVRRKIRRAKTDSGNSVDVARSETGIANLVEIYRCATGATFEEACSELDGSGYGVLKDRVADTLIEVLAPLQKRYAEFESDPATLESILDDGTARAEEVADVTAKVVRSRMGLG